MPKQSAGILLYRTSNQQSEVLLVHPGGPFFKNKDEGAWSIPKGEYLNDEEPLTAAKREFKEETGFAPDGDFKPLKPVKLKSGKVVNAWALEGDMDAETITSNTFEMEWPPKSGKMKAFAEVDRAAWFTAAEARLKVNPAQVPLINQLMEMIA